MVPLPILSLWPRRWLTGSCYDRDAAVFSHFQGLCAIALYPRHFTAVPRAAPPSGRKPSLLSLAEAHSWQRIKEFSLRQMAIWELPQSEVEQALK